MTNNNDRARFNANMAFSITQAVARGLPMPGALVPLPAAAARPMVDVRAPEAQQARKQAATNRKARRKQERQRVQEQRRADAAAKRMAQPLVLREHQLPVVFAHSEQLFDVMAKAKADADAFCGPPPIYSGDVYVHGRELTLIEADGNGPRVIGIDHGSVDGDVAVMGQWRDGTLQDFHTIPLDQHGELRGVVRKGPKHSTLLDLSLIHEPRRRAKLSAITTSMKGGA